MARFKRRKSKVPRMHKYVKIKLFGERARDARSFRRERDEQLSEAAPSARGVAGRLERDGY